MDNSNFNSSVQQSSTGNTNQTFPTFEDMQKNSKKTPHFLIAVIILILVGGGIVWYFFNSDVEYLPTQVHKASVTPAPEAQDQINTIDVGNIDAEFQPIDNDLSSL